jgi:hypothetical protein
MSGFVSRHPEFLNSDKQHVLDIVARQLRNDKIKNWFDDMYDSVTNTFLGRALGGNPPASFGVHKELYDRLKLVEQHLRSLGVTVARGHKTAHGPSGMSPHSWGLAIDIDYEDNPYILGDVSAGWVANSNTSRALQNAVLLMKGETRVINASYLSGLSVKTTSEIYDTLKDLDDAFIGYLALDGNSTGIAEQLQRVTAPALRGQSPGDAARRWLDEIRTDKQNLAGRGGLVPTNFTIGDALKGARRDPTKGFLTLSKELVVTLRDKACLASGAVDMGPACGDFQHFDTRRIPGAGREIMRNSVPPSFIPTQTCYDPAEFLYWTPRASGDD